MGIEIERKFLVKNTDFKKESFQEKSIQQGFLNSDKNRVVRIRIINEKGFITIKGVSNTSGTSRFEWEKEISRQEAEKLLKIIEQEEQKVQEKLRRKQSAPSKSKKDW